MPRKFVLPRREVAVDAAMRIESGTTVRVYAELLEQYGPKRNQFTFEGRVVRRDTLPGSEQLTGRLMVETTVVCHYQKTATRKGTRTYQTAAGKRRVLAVWPWDIAG
jgi:hypothetical protein